MLQATASLFGSTWQYYRGLWYFTRVRGNLKERVLFKQHPYRQVHLFSLACTLRLWHEPHYRAKSLRVDMFNNLTNVAIPGSGFALSVFCRTRWLFVLFLLVVNPLASLLGALYLAVRLGERWDVHYAELLLEPTHWFAVWRLNSILVAYHAFVTGSNSYCMEDKGTFLLEGDKLGLPISPFYKESGLVVKHKNIEGGMGIHFFDNFTCGGDWIIQKQLANSPAITALLPSNAPLSTLRVVTASRRFLSTSKPAGSSKQASRQTDAKKFEDVDTSGISVVTVVFRAGLAGAATDHKSICFDVNPLTGTIGKGASNQHWYKLGLQHVGRPCAGMFTDYTHHPDSKTQISGQCIPGMDDMLATVLRGHAVIVPDVPLVGWDVALTDQGVFLLEINISCNLFMGSFDKTAYTALMHEGFAQLEQQDTLRATS